MEAESTSALPPAAAIPTSYQLPGSYLPEKALTNADLEKLVEEKSFRQDLLYRLNILFLTLPPLREHKDDIPLLANHFIEKL